MATLLTLQTSTTTVSAITTLVTQATATLVTTVADNAYHTVTLPCHIGKTDFSIIKYTISTFSHQNM